MYARVDIALPVGLGVLLYLAWDWGVVAFKVSPMMLPRPGAVFDVVQKNFPLLREHGWSTIRDSASALAISTVVGVAIAFFLSIARWIRAALMPNLVLLELIPKIALAPLFIIWLGTGTESRLAYAFFLSIFPIVVSATSGLVNTDPGLMRLCASLRANPWQTFVHVLRLPHALPLMFGGLKIASTMAVIGVVVGGVHHGQRGLRLHRHVRFLAARRRAHGGRRADARRARHFPVWACGAGRARGDRPLRAARLGRPGPDSGGDDARLDLEAAPDPCNPDD